MKTTSTTNPEISNEINIPTHMIDETISTVLSKQDMSSAMYITMYEIGTDMSDIQNKKLNDTVKKMDHIFNLYIVLLRASKILDLDIKASGTYRFNEFINIVESTFLNKTNGFDHVYLFVLNNYEKVRGGLTFHIDGLQQNNEYMRQQVKEFDKFFES